LKKIGGRAQIGKKGKGKPNQGLPERVKRSFGEGLELKKGSDGAFEEKKGSEKRAE